MKKLLSILICVLLGVTTLFAEKVGGSATPVSIEGNAAVVGKGGKVKVVGESDDDVWTYGTDSYSKSTSRLSREHMYMHAKQDDGYYFVGWAESYGNDGSYKLISDYTHELGIGFSVNGKSSSNPLHYAASSVATSGSNLVRYAIFRRYYLATLYGYNVEKDQFETTPLGNVPEESAVYTDMLEINVSNFEKLYKLSFNHPIGNIDDIVYSSEKFIVDIKTIGTDTVMVVKNKGAIDGQVSDAIKLYVKNEWNKDKTVNGIIATLNFTVTNEPIYVTLNPAEDLTGRYTYTQNTTGLDEFSVTTSAVVKQMITATDYSFTFNPTPEDPSKYQFEKWVIKDKEGNVVEERIEPNLSYTFQAGQSITPVFTTFDRAVFIVKSEPAIQYTDLQQALDRAAALTTTTGKNQTVVVTVDAEGKRKGGRLVQGTYTITNGVTFLIPGEKSYEEMKGDLKDSHFQEEGSDHNAFCTLSVDDDTKIIVKNGGSISLYAKLVRTTTYTNGYITFNYGHMILGRNCQINVENGGQLHAFGFITGDPSSHVTMESGSLIYEPFTMTDWRGGSETSSKWVLGSDGKNARVFPIGQYYVQSVEVPLTFKAGAREKLSCSVDAGVTATVNMDYISNYSDAEGLFGLGEGTSLTRTYNPATDRVKYAFNGTGTSSKVKLGCMNLKLRVAIFNIDINSKDFVMPIQNNIDIDVKNTTIDVKYDLACLPASTMRVHDDAIINVESNANVYIYDRGARRFATDASDAKGFGGYWMSQNKVIVPLSTKARPGGIQYGHTNAAGKFTAGRTEEDLVDASWIINGDMNIHGALYTVCGKFAEADDKDPDAQGGADISSEGSGKINVYKIGTKTTINQWDQANAVGAVTIPITQYLLLHNDLSKGATAAYTPVKNESNQNLSSNPLSYTYYQHDGTWRLPIAGITGIKLYDAEDHEITNFYVTLPNDNVTGYLLATLEPIIDIEYDVDDFDIQLSAGNIVIVNDADNKPAIVNDGKQLKIPVVYTPKNIHGEHPQTLTITNTSDAGFDCDFEETLLAIEDYNPIFEAPTTMNIYGRVSEPNPAALLIKPADKNITTLSEVNPNMVWTYEITSTNDDKEQFDFKFGEGAGNKLAGAQVIFTPNSVGEKKAKLILTATYKDAGNPQNVLTKVHNVELVGNGLIIDNTMEFNNVGTITTSTTNAFNLLCNVNSTGDLIFNIVDEATKTLVPNDATYTSNEIIDIQYTTIDGKGNYLITPKRKIGQVTVEVFQKGTTSHSSKTITTTIIVVGDPKPLEGQVCLDENTFPTLTEDLDFVEYDADRLNFVGDGSSSTWTAQFASAPGVLTFTPHGDGYWAVQESMDGVNWSEIIWWTQLPADKEVYVTLSPRTRRVKISYRKINEIGSITNLCISPFSIYAETTKSYVPVKDGSILPTSIVFTHATPNVEVRITPKNAAQLDLTNLSEPTLSTSTSGNLGGVLNTFYQTTVTLSGGANIPELNDAFTLIAKHGTEEAEVTLATYAFPKPLPMKSNTWVSDDAKNNINGYDEAEYYNHYMVSSKNVKWDADPERRNLVFLNPGSKSGDQALRQVVFGYKGLPDELRFESAATGWKIEQSIDGTESSWVDLNAQTPTDGKYTIPLTNDPQYVRITYNNPDNKNEVSLNNLIIEGFPSAVPSSTEVVITKTDDQDTPPSETFTIHVRNLPSMQIQLDRTDVFELYDQNGILINNGTPLTSEYLALNKKGDITITAKWTGYTTSMLDEGFVQILNPSQDNAEMATIRLVGKKSGITASVTNTGIWTGVPDGTTNTEKHILKDTKNIFEPYTYHEVNLANTFDENKTPLFDYLIIFGETTTTDNTTDILQPTAEIGSNAKTPYYIYKRDADKKTYEFVNAIANANSAEKGVDGTVIVAAENVDKNMTSYINVQGDEQDKKEISVYITGFCPYATTGYTKNEEGVFLFRGNHGDKLDVYLDNCHIYSRNKSEKGTSFYGEKEGGETYSEGYARGSGGVLVFENMDAQEQLDLFDPFEVNIHTRGNNLLNSNYGCFFGLQIGNSIAMKAYQVSSPIQVHMFSDNHVNKTKTTLNFDDIWPTGEQTNGYLALKKQANNAPSIDMGNKYTEVNFNGGRIKLQNSQIVSGTYKTTLAISYRAGFFGAEEAGIKLCHGIGTDAVDGVVNFNDGTVTVERMKVAEEHRQYYLMDLKDDGTESEYTTCLRTPKNTFINGGSICRVRACQSVTSKGGGPKEGGEPKEGVDKRLLGQYVYNVFEKGETRKDNGTYTITVFPNNITDLGPYNYGLNSITPDENGDCYFWIPDGFGGVTAEKDVYMATWKACMTKIGAGIPDVAEGEVGGDIRINEDEEVQNFLYCQLDKNIHDVISAVDDKGAYTYEAPIEVPSVAQSYFKSKYTKWAPNKVGEQLQHEVLSEKSYTIANRVYYITTATADVWKTFTAPFDVANIYVVETYKEDLLEKITSRSEILKAQAQHNADFAAFFGVAMAMGTTANFEGIYNSYIEWAKIQDKAMNLWNGRDKYTLRGMQKLTPYFGNNWRDANFYLNKNTGIWNVTEGVDEDGELTYSFDVQWKFLNQADTVGGTLLHKGQTYSLMFPYCPGCDAMLEDRTSWDYWSGKFLIFESTSKPQTINGRDFLNENIEGNVFSQTYDANQVIVSGNSTFAKLETTRENIHVYDDGIDSEGKGAYNNESFVMKENAFDLATIQPTTAFLYGYVPANQFGMPAKRVTRDGRIIYGESGDNNDPNNGTTTGSHTPTIGGGNSLFVTGIAGGINIAVAQPQFVQVISATGVVLYNGYVTDNVNVPLPINGIYVIKGENEVQKIFF